ncbi:hypothetical protein EGW08_011800, partial [Elysia chlorotica]
MMSLFGCGAEHTLGEHENDLYLAAELSLFSQPLTVTVVDPAALSSEDPQLCDVFSCLFCDHLSAGEVSISLHLAEVHKCRSLFSCTECDYQCSTKELFSTHVGAHISKSSGEVQGYGTGNDGRFIQGEVVIKQETLEDADGSQSDIGNDLVVPSVKSKTRKRRNVSACTESHSLENKSDQRVDIKRETSKTATELLNTLPNFNLGGKDLNIVKFKDHSLKKSKSNFTSFQGLVKALRNSPTVILDMPGGSFSDCEKFSCFVCGHSTKRFLNFKEHFMKHFDLTPFVCEICSAGFVNRRRLKLHLNSVHATTRQFLCASCPYAAKSLDGLKKHERLKHPREEDLKYPCPDCEQKFAIYQQLQNHQHLKHKLDKKFVCDLCNFSCNHSNRLQSHMNRHMGRVFLCFVCGHGYASKYLLNNHMLTHNSATSFPCDKCSFSSRHRNGLRSHMRVHSNERPYKCSLCSYQAKSKGTVKVHMKKHLPARRFACGQCEKAFKFKHHLERHTEQHSGVALACNLCDYSASSSSSYQRHMVLHDPSKRKNCSLCDRFFATPGELSRHMSKVHSDCDAGADG